MPRAKTASKPRNASDASFNADERARKRAEGVITIGEQQFHRRLKNHGVTREARAKEVAQERLNARIAAIERELFPHESETEEQEEAREALTLEEREAKQDEVTKLGDEAMQKTYDLVALLIEDEAGNPPPMKLLHDKLDVEELSALSKDLLGGGEPATGPTQTPSSSN
jgi:hypothetical protein